MVHTGMYVQYAIPVSVLELPCLVHPSSTHPSLEKHFCVGNEEGSMQSLTGIICILQVLFEVIYRWKYNTRYVAQKTYLLVQCVLVINDEEC